MLNALTFVPALVVLIVGFMLLVAAAVLVGKAIPLEEPEPTGREFKILWSAIIALGLPGIACMAVSTITVMEAILNNL